MTSWSGNSYHASPLSITSPSILYFFSGGMEGPRLGAERRCQMWSFHSRTWDGNRGTLSQDLVSKHTYVD